MIATISKEFHFSASHQLKGLPESHPCARLHGHNYIVTVELEGQTDDVGFVFDYGELAAFGTYLDETLDHRDLNDALPINPTAEYLARHLVTVLRDVVSTHLVENAPHPLSLAITVSETPKTTAQYWERW